MRPRTLRLASGLVLLSYVGTHLLNHAVGLVSVAAADTARHVFVGFWRSWPGTAAFYGALLLHFGLALAALYERRSLRMPTLELARIVLGFAIPLLLAEHWAGTRIASQVSGQADTYARTVAAMWGSGFPAQQLALLVVAWLHGCFGIHLAFRSRAWYRRWLPQMMIAATLVPALAFTGFLSMARELADRPPAPPLAAGQEASVRLAHQLGLLVPLLLLAAALAARRAQLVLARRRHDLIRIAYPSREVEVPAGFSVLEASRAFGIPHLSVCGGRARCSTCRVRVEWSERELPPARPDEARTLARIGLPPDVRLACQLRPQGAIRVHPLLPVRDGGRALEQWGRTTERDVVVLFADLRRWTGLAQERLPLDLAYVLDQYFEAVGDAVREAGGIPNQFIGDSVMALFGVTNDPAAAARQALAAAAGIERRMAVLNERLTAHHHPPLEFGIGIHAGTAAVGTVGYRNVRTLSAVGDAVNTASRLQEATKALQARAVVSEEVLRRAGAPIAGWERHELAIRGREGRLTAYARRSFLSSPPSS